MENSCCTSYWNSRIILFLFTSLLFLFANAQGSLAQVNSKIVDSNWLTRILINSGYNPKNAIHDYKREHLGNQQLLSRWNIYKQNVTQELVIFEKTPRIFTGTSDCVYTDRIEFCKN